MFCFVMSLFLVMSFVLSATQASSHGEYVNRLDFPDGFMFGVSSSSYQEVGVSLWAYLEDGKSINNWDVHALISPEVEGKKSGGGGGGAVVVVFLWLWLWWWCCCGAIVVVLWWCCGGGVVLWWWCGAAVLRYLLFGSGVVVVNMENYEDEPVTLTCRNEDAVAVCQLAVLHLILLGRQPAHNIPEWWFRFYAYQALPNHPPAKYTLSGFTWAFKGQSKPKPEEVREHYGLSDFDFSVLQNTEDRPKTFTKQTSSSFFDMAQRTPTYPDTFEELIPSWNPTYYFGTPYIATPMALQGFATWSSTNQAHPSQNPGTPHIATPMAQQGFAPWSSTNQAGPSQNRDVGVVNPDEMRRGKRETFPSKYQLSPFTCMPSTMVAPKKRANNIRNTTRNAEVSSFNLAKSSIDLNSPVGKLMYMDSRATDDYISLHNMDPNKVVRNKYVD
ncbi:phospholipase-like protein, partial [Tanacetum coccineum]